MDRGRVGGYKKSCLPFGKATLLWSPHGLETVADAKGDVTPVEARAGDEPEIGADVQRELDGDGVEVVLDTSLADEGESHFGVFTIVCVTGVIGPEGQTGTEAVS